MKIEFEIDGKSYDFVTTEKITFGEAKYLEKTSGYTVAEIETDQKIASTLDVLMTLILISMKRKEPTLVLDDLNDLPMGATLSAIGEAVEKAQAEEEAKAAEAEAKKKAENPTEGASNSSALA